MIRLKLITRDLVAILSLAGMVFSTLIVLGGCKSRIEKEISFTTIEREEWIGKPRYEGENIQGKVATSNDEVNDFGAWVSADARSKLNTLDYSKYFALAVFRGREPSSGYDIEITSITRQDNTITIQIELQVPEPDQQVNTVITSPYHLIQIEKTGNWNEDFTFNVVHDGSIVASLSHSIP